MSIPRIKPGGTAVYHCMSRIVSGDRRLDVHAKEVLRKMLRQVAAFSGVEVLAYCLMTNHFHVLVRVPKRDLESLTKAEVLRRYRFLYETSNTPGYPDAEGMRLIFEGEDEALAQKWMDRLSARMQDVSEFIKTLKQRFSLWYNKARKHFGTLWAEKFKSVLVENHPDTLKTVAAYLDLNPVRAKLVEDPAEYRWCSYAEAMGGDQECAEGLAKVMGQKTWNEAAADYRMVLFGKGGVARRQEQGTIPEEIARRVLRKGGKIETWELLRCRVRFFSDGAILGSESFVREMAAAMIGRRGGAFAENAPSTPPAETSGSPTPKEKILGKLYLADGIDLNAWRKLQVCPVGAGPDETIETSATSA